MNVLPSGAGVPWTAHGGGFPELDGLRLLELSAFLFLPVWSVLGVQGLNPVPSLRRKCQAHHPAHSRSGC